jgi:protease II
VVQFIDQMRQHNAAFVNTSLSSLLREITSTSPRSSTPRPLVQTRKPSLHFETGDVFPTLTFPPGSPGESSLRLDPFLRREGITSISRIAVSPDTLRVAIITRGQSSQDLGVLNINRSRNYSHQIKLAAYDLLWAGNNSLLVSTLTDGKPRQVSLVQHDAEPVLLYSTQHPAYEIILSPQVSATHTFIEVRSPTSSTILSSNSTTPTELRTILAGDLPGAACTFWRGKHTCLSYRNDRVGEVFVVEQGHKRVLAQGSQRRPITRIHSDEDQLLLFSSTGTASNVQVLSSDSEPPIRIEPLGPVTTLLPVSSQTLDGRSLLEAHSFVAPPRVMTVGELVNFHRPESQPDGHLQTTKNSYSEEALTIPSSDQVAIPVSLARPPIVRGLLIQTYGAYGIPSKAEHSPQVEALLAQGIAVAVAHVRGGGELGPGWHIAGRGPHKRRAIEDLVSVTKGLQQYLHVPPHKTVMYGRSAGGWLVARSILTNTDLCSAIILDAPLLNLKSAVSSSDAPLYHRELVEWGNSHAAQEISATSLTPTQPLSVHIFLSVPMRDSLISPYETLSWALQARCSQQSDYAMVLHTMPTADHDGPTSAQDVRSLETLQRAFITQVISLQDESGSLIKK